MKGAYNPHAAADAILEAGRVARGEIEPPKPAPPRERSLYDPDPEGEAEAAAAFILAAGKAASGER